MEKENTITNNSYIPREKGTLAIDLGNSTTVVAFQNENNSQIQLLNLAPLCREPGQIPSIVWSSTECPPYKAIGNEVVQLGLEESQEANIISDFKRWICAPNQPIIKNPSISPEKAGEILIHEIWKKIPHQLEVKRLVLTAPVETYRKYRCWLFEVCKDLQVSEIALVDEPTAAAMGAGLAPGSKLLVVDIGGSTIDMSLVELQGGEGKAEPVAQLLRFGGHDLAEKSNQILRCAKVLGKAGQRIGGRDIDRWIANHLSPNTPITESLLNSAERLKCKLSEPELKETKILVEKFNNSSKSNSQELRLCKQDLEQLLKDRGFLKSLETLLKHTLASGISNSCALTDIDKIVLVGGGARIPLIKKWLKDQCAPVPLLTPPPIETVAVGALNLTPGVTVRDVLQKGVSLRCWDQKNKIHMWHPLFIAGQPWPTTKPLEIILAASKVNQQEIELKIGEPDFEGANEVIYIDGIPTIKEGPQKPTIRESFNRNISILLSNPAQPGEDCLKLQFSINNDCELNVAGNELKSSEEIQPRNLGSIR